MTSTAYRQSSRQRPGLSKADPDNRLLGRMSVRRLEAEAVRDAVLAVSGRLSARPFGPPVPVMRDNDGQVVLGVDIRDTAGYPQGKPVPLGEDEFRRGVYVQARRSLPLTMMETFDAPAMTPCCEARSSSTVTPQALLLMNSKFILDRAADLGRRVREEAGEDARRQAAAAWRLAFAAEPSPRDLDDAAAFLEAQARQFQGAANLPPGTTPRQLALATFCQALLGSNQFLYVD
jgi:hypothetical protein